MHNNILKFQMIQRLLDKLVWTPLSYIAASLAADLKVLVLSDEIVGRSHLLVNCQKARRDELTFKSGTSFK